MAADTMAFAHGSATHPARLLRRLVQAAFGGPMQASAGAVSPTTFGGAHGVIGDGLAVAYVSGTTVSVAAGTAVITGPLLAQGAYAWGNDASTNVVCTAHAVSPRIDLIVVRVQDTDEDASGSEDAGLTYITGTPAGSPAVPSIPSSASYLVLAEVLWPATSGAPTITDRRPRAAAIGGKIRCKSTTRPTGAALYVGLEIYELDTGYTRTWNGSAWRFVYSEYTTVSGTYVALTDGSGQQTAPYGLTFASAPIVVLTNGDDAAADYTASIVTAGTTSVTFQCRDPATGAALTATTVRINWIAHGLVGV